MTNFKQLLTIAVACMTLACRSTDQVVTKTTETETMHINVDNAHELRVSGPYKVLFTQGPASLKITASNNIMPYVDAKVSDGRVLLNVKSDMPQVNVDVVAELSLPQINNVKMSGASKFTASEISADELKLYLTEASLLKCDTLKASELEFDLSGAASAGFLKINANEFCIDIRGASNVNLNTLEVRESEMEVTGASKLTVRNLNSTELDLNVSGASNVTMAGTANVAIIDVSGASIADITKLQCLNKRLYESGSSKIRQ